MKPRLKFPGKADEAARKQKALDALCRQFDAKTLEALARRGKTFINHPTYGPLIRKELGL